MQSRTMLIFKKDPSSIEVNGLVERLGEGIGMNDECDWNEWMIRLVFPLLSVWSLLRLLCLLPVRLIVDFGGGGGGVVVVSSVPCIFFLSRSFRF